MDAKYRRIGLGKFILKCTIENMIDIHCWRSSLNVNTKNKAAIKLYDSCGYVIDSSIRKGFYGPSDPIGPDAYSMEKTLPGMANEFCNKLNVNEWNLVQRINGLLVAMELFCENTMT